MEHLAHPLLALREMRRVLKPGGIVAVRDPDFGTGFWEPTTPLLQAASELMLRIREHQGGNPYYARHLRQLLVEAGFVRVEAFAFAEWQGSDKVTAAFGGVAAEVLQEPRAVALAIEQGWADRQSIEAMAAEILIWSKRADAFRALVDCAAIGWVSDKESDTRL